MQIYVRLAVYYQMHFMRRVNVIIFLLLCSFICGAQKTVSNKEPKLLGTFDFTQFLGGVILIQARLDTLSEQLTFILDTGSGGISLDSTTCSEFNIVGVKTDTTLSGIGGTKKVKFVFNKTLYLNNIEIDSLNFHINDYTALSRIYGYKIDGIIGYSFFSRYIVKIDYDNKKVLVYSPGKFIYPKNGYLLTPLFTKLPIQTAIINDGRKINFPFYFDTGAGLALLMSNKFESDSIVLKKNRKQVITGVDGILGRSEMRLTVVKKVTIGPYSFKNVPTYLYEDSHNVTGYPNTGGLLGSELFRRFNVILNYPAREIHLLPNSHFNDPFDYSYSGMNLFYLEGAIIIDDVIPGSPADISGLKVGDQVISVGNDFSLNIESYRNTLQVAYAVIRIIIKRNNNLEAVSLRTTSILR